MGGEECDDGNLLENDGCSPACRYEPYFYCLRRRVEIDFLTGGIRLLPDSISDAEALQQVRKVFVNGTDVNDGLDPGDVDWVPPTRGVVNTTSSCIDTYPPFVAR